MYKLEPGAVTRADYSRGGGGGGGGNSRIYSIPIKLYNHYHQKYIYSSEIEFFRKANAPSLASDLTALQMLKGEQE